MGTAMNARMNGKFVQISLRAPIKRSRFSVKNVCGWAEVDGDCVVLFDDEREAHRNVVLIVPQGNIATIHLVCANDIKHLQDAGSELSNLYRRAREYDEDMKRMNDEIRAYNKVCESIPSTM